MPRRAPSRGPSTRCAGSARRARAARARPTGAGWPARRRDRRPPSGGGRAAAGPGRRPPARRPPPARRTGRRARAAPASGGRPPRSQALRLWRETPSRSATRDCERPVRRRSRRSSETLGRGLDLGRPLVQQAQQRGGLDPQELGQRRHVVHRDPGPPGLPVVDAGGRTPTTSAIRTAGSRAARRSGRRPWPRGLSGGGPAAGRTSSKKPATVAGSTASERASPWMCSGPGRRSRRSHRSTDVGWTPSSRAMSVVDSDLLVRRSRRRIGAGTVDRST